MKYPICTFWEYSRQLLLPLQARRDFMRWGLVGGRRSLEASLWMLPHGSCLALCFLTMWNSHRLTLLLSQAFPISMDLNPLKPRVKIRIFPITSFMLGIVSVMRSSQYRKRVPRTDCCYNKLNRVVRTWTWFVGGMWKSLEMWTEEVYNTLTSFSGKPGNQQTLCSWNFTVDKEGTRTAWEPIGATF